MRRVDPASLIVAVTGVAALVLAEVTRRRGEKKQATQERAADVLARREQEFTQQGLIIDRLEAELERTDRRHAEEMAEQRRRHSEEMSTQRQVCTEAREDMARTIGLLTSVIRDEVAKAAGVDAIERATAHADDDHGRG